MASRNSREGHYRGRHGGKHWRTLTGWIDMLRTLHQLQRTPAGIRCRTAQFLSASLRFITVIDSDSANDRAIEIIMWTLDFIRVEDFRHPLARELDRVSDLVVAYETVRYPEFA